MIQKYRIGGKIVSAEDVDFPAVLVAAYAKKDRVFCECRKDVELQLYISHRFERHVLSRWPGSGSRHATACDHYEAPDFLTGMGQVKGAAVQDNEVSGETVLKVDFPLTRGPARLAPSALTNDKASIKSTGQKLTMRGMLHFLWDRAQLTHWHPKMAGRRNWFVVRRALLDAAGACRLKMEAMGDVMFIPESFRIDDKGAIASRRNSALERVRRSTNELMIVIGAVKEIEPAHGGSKIVLSQVGNAMPFTLDPDMTRRFNKRFEGELSLWRAGESSGAHLIIAGTFRRRVEGIIDLIEVSLMPVTKEWMPYESIEESLLIAKAVRDNRRFVKGMRVNLDRTVQIASMVLKDTGDRATAVYLHDPKEEASEALRHLMASEAVDHLCWCEGEALAPRGGRGRPSAEPLAELAAGYLAAPEAGAVVMPDGEVVAVEVILVVEASADGSVKPGFEAYPDGA